MQLVVPEGFREKVLRLAHETVMSGHLGRFVTDLFFCLEFVVMRLDFVNLVIFVRGLFRKVVSLL